MTKTTHPNRTGRSRLRRLFFVILALGILLAVAYFAGTSSWFLRRVVIPRVANGLNSEIAVDEVALSPFSQLKVRNLTLQAADSEPFLEIGEALIRYNLFSILAGSPRIQEISILSPTLTIIQEADGRTNLDPLLGALAGEPNDQETKDSPTRLTVANLAAKNATLRLIQKAADGSISRRELSALEISLDRFANQEPGALSLSSRFQIETVPPPNEASVPVDSLSGTISGAFKFSLNDALTLEDLNGTATLAVAGATGAYAEFTGYQGDLEARLTPTAIETLTLAFHSAADALGTLTVNGPFNLDRQEAQLTIRIESLDSRLLDLATVSHGLSFNPTTLNSTNLLELTQNGSQIAVSGKLSANSLALKRSHQTTPPLDIQLAYDTRVNLTDQYLLLRAADLTARQDSGPLLEAHLDRPMTLTWSGQAPGFAESLFQLSLTNLQLADWQLLLGTNFPSGTVAANLTLLARDNGTVLEPTLSAGIDGLSLPIGTNRLTGARLTLRSSGSIEHFNRLRLDPFEISLHHASTNLFQAKGTLRADLANDNFEIHSALNAAPAAWLAQSTGPSDSMPEWLALQLNASLENNRITLTNTVLTLPPTDRAENALRFDGQLDLATNNASSNTITIAANALDLTPFYPRTTRPDSPSAQEEVSPKEPDRSSSAEPAPVELPLRQLDANLKIDRLFLREIAASNLTATIRIDDTKLSLAPLTFTLNGAPVRARATIDLGVPGYQYTADIAAIQVPVEPIANTFLPALHGKYQGNLYLNTQITGAGLTGPNLRRSLDGAFSLTFTNANLQIAGPRLKLFLTPVATFLGAPDLLREPLSWVRADLRLGDGKFKIEQFSLVSAAFTAATQGEMPIADQVMNSSFQNWPMALALRRPIAERIRLLPSDAPTEAEYIPLPNFLQVGGTLNSPRPKFNVDRQSLGSLLQKYGTKIPGLDEKTGNLISNLGGLISGQRPASNNTNLLTATNRLSPFDLLKLLPAPNQSTNAAGQPSPTNAAPKINLSPLDLLKLLPGPLTNSNASTNSPTNAPPPLNPFDLFRSLQPKPRTNNP